MWVRDAVPLEVHRDDEYHTVLCTDCAVCMCVYRETKVP